MAKYCVNCGNKLSEGDKACRECGTMVNSSNGSKTNNKSNGFAISGFVVSLVSSLLCCGIFNTISLILSIIGLVKAKEYNDNGKAFAIAGIVISSIPILLHILAAIIGSATSTHVSVPFVQL